MKWNLFSLFRRNKSGRQKEAAGKPVGNGIEGKPVADNPLKSLLQPENEFELLTLVQGEIKKGRILLRQHTLGEARNVLMPVKMLMKQSLIANMDSERYEKLLDIIECSSLIADTYVEGKDYAAAYEEADDALLFAEQLTVLASNRPGTLQLIARLYCTYLSCCHKTGNPKGAESVHKKLESVLSLLSAIMCDGDDNGKAGYFDTVCNLVEELIGADAYEDATRISLQTISPFEWKELEDPASRHSFAILHSRYAYCLLNTKPIDVPSCLDACRIEVAMFEDLAAEDDSVRAKMDLAVACSHRAVCHSYREDEFMFLCDHLKKIELLGAALRQNCVEEDPLYNNQALSDSIVQSIRAVVQEFGEIDENNLHYYSDLYKAIRGIDDYYKGSGALLAHINLIAGELFKITNKRDPATAQDCLSTRFSNLIYLVHSFGREDNIILDLSVTVEIAKPFIINHKSEITEELNSLYLEALSIVLFENDGKRKND